MTRPRLYVTGATGAIGGALLGRLAGVWPGPVAVSRQRPASLGPAAEWRPDGGLPDCGWLDGDDTAPRAAIVHCADRADALGTGQDSAAHLAMMDGLIARGWRGRLVLLSSAAVYGEPARLPIAETAPSDAITAYGRHKLAVEAGLMARAGPGGPEVVVLRVSNPYGTARDLDRRRVAALIACACLTGQPFTVYGAPTSVRDYLHIDDLARAVALALVTPMAAPRLVLNIGSGVGTTLRDLIDRIERLTGRALNRQVMPARPEAAASVLDITRAGQRLGWRPEVGLDRGLEMLVEALAAQA